MKTLILGGIRSGKSRLAEQLAKDSGKQVSYIATASAGDEEMQERIHRHQQRRPEHWQLIEEPLYVSRALEKCPQNSCILLECLTLWLLNCLTHSDSDFYITQRNLLLKRLQCIENNLIVVSNETNMGVVPMGELSRRYCDEAGLIHQELALFFDRVILVVAGLPQIIKG